MAFWSNGGLNIKRSFQWVGNVVFRADPGLVDGPRIFIPQFTDSVTPFLITSFSRPTLDVGSIEVKDSMGPAIKYLSSTPVWKPITVKAIDVINSKQNTTRVLYQFLRGLGYDDLAAVDAGNWANVNEMINKLGEGNAVSLSLSSLTPRGKIYETWTFTKPVLQSFSFGEDASYDNDDKVTVTMEFKIASAKYEYLGD